MSRIWSQKQDQDKEGAPRHKDSVSASRFMALGLAFHFFGYESARAASMSLISSKTLGMGDEVLSYTVMVGLVASSVVFYLYATSIKKYGPRFTLRASEIACCVQIFFMVLVCDYLDHESRLGQVAVVGFYAYREIYVTLLSTQQWSFIVSVLDQKNSNHIVSFAGIVSLSSALGGMAVEYIVLWWGVKGLLLNTLLFVASSCFCSEWAYLLVPSGSKRTCARATPQPRPSRGLSASRSTSSAANGLSAGTARCITVTDTPPVCRKGLFRESVELFRQHTTLRYVYCEAIAHQLIVNMLNLLFHNALKQHHDDAGQRAVIVGRFFGMVNVAVCALQFFILPHILSTRTLPDVLRTLPLVLGAACTVCFMKPCLALVMLAFGTMKVIEYAVLSAAGEMIYIPMGLEVRYLGKELVKFFGHKMGKSGSSILLSCLNRYFMPSLVQESAWILIGTGLWAGSIVLLAGHLEHRDALKSAPAPVHKNIVRADEMSKMSVMRRRSGQSERGGTPGEDEWGDVGTDTDRASESGDEHDDNVESRARASHSLCEDARGADISSPARGFESSGECKDLDVRSHGPAPVWVRKHDNLSSECHVASLLVERGMRYETVGLRRRRGACEGTTILGEMERMVDEDFARDHNGEALLRVGSTSVDLYSLVGQDINRDCDGSRDDSFAGTPGATDSDYTHTQTSFPEHSVAEDYGLLTPGASVNDKQLVETAEVMETLTDHIISAVHPHPPHVHRVIKHIVDGQS